MNITRPTSENECAGHCSYDYIERNEITKDFENEQRDSIKQEYGITSVYPPKCKCKGNGGDKCVDDTCINRRRCIACNPKTCGPRCCNNPWDLKGFAAGSKTYLKHTDEKNFCLFANELIRKNEWIGEYRGVIQRGKAADNDANGGGEEYMFALPNVAQVIDAQKKGTCTRLINHSCRNANCVAYAYVHKLRYKILLMAQMDIEKDQELTINYGWTYSNIEEATKCACESIRGPHCIGTLSSKMRALTVKVDQSQNRDVSCQDLLVHLRSIRLGSSIRNIQDFENHSDMLINNWLENHPHSSRASTILCSRVLRFYRDRHTWNFQASHQHEIHDHVVIEVVNYVQSVISQDDGDADYDFDLGLVLKKVCDLLNLPLHMEHVIQEYIFKCLDRRSAPAVEASSDACSDAPGRQTRYSKRQKRKLDAQEKECIARRNNRIRDERETRVAPGTIIPILPEPLEEDVNSSESINSNDGRMKLGILFGDLTNPRVYDALLAFILHGNSTKYRITYFGLPTFSTGPEFAQLEQIYKDMPGNDDMSKPTTRKQPNKFQILHAGSHYRPKRKGSLGFHAQLSMAQSLIQKHKKQDIMLLLMTAEEVLSIQVFIQEKPASHFVLNMATYNCVYVPPQLYGIARLFTDQYTIPAESFDAYGQTVTTLSVTHMNVNLSKYPFMRYLKKYKYHPKGCPFVLMSNSPLHAMWDLPYKQSKLMDKVDGAGNSATVTDCTVTSPSFTLFNYRFYFPLKILAMTQKQLQDTFADTGSLIITCPHCYGLPTENPTYDILGCFAHCSQLAPDEYFNLWIELLKMHKTLHIWLGITDHEDIRTRIRSHMRHHKEAGIPTSRIHFCSPSKRELEILLRCTLCTVGTVSYDASDARQVGLFTLARTPCVVQKSGSRMSNECVGVLATCDLEDMSFAPNSAEYVHKLENLLLTPHWRVQIFLEKFFKFLEKIIHDLPPFKCALQVNEFENIMAELVLPPHNEHSRHASNLGQRILDWYKVPQYTLRPLTSKKLDHTKSKKNYGRIQRDLVLGDMFFYLPVWSLEEYDEAKNLTHRFTRKQRLITYNRGQPIINTSYVISAFVMVLENMKDNFSKLPTGIGMVYSFILRLQEFLLDGFPIYYARNHEDFFQKYKFFDTMLSMKYVHEHTSTNEEQNESRIDERTNMKLQDLAQCLVRSNVDHPSTHLSDVKRCLFCDKRFPVTPHIDVYANEYRTQDMRHTYNTVTISQDGTKDPKSRNAIGKGWYCERCGRAFPTLDALNAHNDESKKRRPAAYRALGQEINAPLVVPMRANTGKTRMDMEKYWLEVFKSHPLDKPLEGYRAYKDSPAEWKQYNPGQRAWTFMWLRDRLDDFLALLMSNDPVNLVSGTGFIGLQILQSLQHDMKKNFVTFVPPMTRGKDGGPLQCRNYQRMSHFLGSFVFDEKTNAYDFIVGLFLQPHTKFDHAKPCPVCGIIHSEPESRRKHLIRKNELESAEEYEHTVVWMEYNPMKKDNPRIVR